MRCRTRGGAEAVVVVVKLWSWRLESDDETYGSDPCIYIRTVTEKNNVQICILNDA
jgi:hypothetical protein